MSHRKKNGRHRLTICSICGQAINGYRTIDHIFPAEIFKWSDNETVKHIIDGKDNKAPAHRECNYNKQDMIPDLEKVFIAEWQKEKLFQDLQQIKPDLIHHQQMKNQLYQNQNGKCYWCRKELCDVRILRRIDPDQERVWENACLVCKLCNDINASFIKNIQKNP